MGYMERWLPRYRPTSIGRIFDRIAFTSPLTRRMALMWITTNKHNSGSNTITIRALDAARIAVGSTIAIAGEEMTHVVVNQYLSDLPGGYMVDIVPPLSIDLNGSHHIRIIDPHAVGAGKLEKSWDEIRKLEDALSRATELAEKTETGRVEAEREFAERMADAMVAGNVSIPSKPSSLTSIQAADDAADAALESIRERLGRKRSEHRNMANEEARSRVKEEYGRDAAVARRQIRVIAYHAKLLSESVGGAYAKQLVDRISEMLFLIPPADRVQTAVHGAMLNTGDKVDINALAMDAKAEVGWPSPTYVRSVMSKTISGE